MYFNWIRTAFLLALLTAILLVLGLLFGGIAGLTTAFILAMAINFFSYWYSDKIVLAMYGARQLTREDAPEIHKIVEEITKEANMPKPKIYVIPSNTPNAFATGRNPRNSAVAVTSGIVNVLDREELKGVLAHELAHIKNYDTLISTIAAVIAGVISYIGLFALYGRDENRNPLFLLIALIVAPLVALIIRMAISRTREFAADELGAGFTKQPIALANALYKLEYTVSRIPMRNANEGTAHMFIVNPFAGKSLIKLFSTHPPTEERIERLKNINY